MAVTVVLLRKDELFRYKLEEGHSVTFGSHKKDNVYVDGFAQAQISIRYQPSKISLNAVKAYNCEMNDVPLDSMIILDKAEKTALYISSFSDRSEQKIRLEYGSVLKFGRDKSNDIMLKFPFVSSFHFILRYEDGVVRVEDTENANGLYLNGKRIKKAKMKSGDVLSILSVGIVLVNGELYFENTGNKLSVDYAQIANKNSVSQEHDRDGMKYKRSPRMQQKLPSEDIILAAPPAKRQKYEKSRGMMASLFGSGAMVGASMLTGAMSPALLAARAASLVMPVSSIASSGSGDKKRKKSIEQYEAMRREKYGAYIDEQKARIDSVARIQREILTEENPTPDICIENVSHLNRSLWERMPSDRDYLDVRVGMGYEKLCVNVKSRNDSSGFQLENDEIRELTEKIVEETRIVDNIPARISLLQNNTIGITGNRGKAINLVRNMLISLTSQHCFSDVKIAGFFDEEERDIWDSLKWLPHIWNDDNEYRFLAYNRKNMQEICEVLSEVMKARKAVNRGYCGNKPVIAKPYYIVLLGSKKMAESEPFVNELLDSDTSAGFTTFFLFDDIYSLPNECKFIIDLDNGPYAYAKNESNNKFYFTPDAPVPTEKFERFARQLSAVELDSTASEAAIPDSVTFLEGYGIKRVEELNISDRWKKSEPYKSLAAPIGAMAGNKIFSLDIHDKHHGPHGLVAGTTGSGKSELLQTWILSMCVCYHPYEVNFVIIDYKGGGMENLLEPLPHVVGKITNIGSDITRSLLSLKSESVRRQKIFEKVCANHIDKYQKMYREGKVDEPLPHLIIVSDEFAELKKAEPDFMAGLVSVARVGRSLGIHLVLATQKPGGVVDDQISSNTSFRLCMKVQTVADSREMLKRPDAAMITKSGRTYVRVGEDELFDVFQAFWSGAPYSDREQMTARHVNEVRIVDDSGRRIKTVDDSKAKAKSDTDELSAIISYICSEADKNGIRKPKSPWKPELPEIISLGAMLTESTFDGVKWGENSAWLSAPIGVYDIPSQQEQDIQYIDLAESGHLGIYGASGSGKTMLLKTIICSYCLNYPPSDVNVYILDCGGWSMSRLSCLLHVGGVALDSEEEKFEKFPKMISDELARRKSLFAGNAVGSLGAYRKTVAKDIPAIIIAIDNIIPVFDLYPDMEPLLVTIAREGASFGIYLIFTANSTSGVRYKVQQNIKNAVAFELTDKGDYSTLVGKIDGLPLPHIPGRAFIKGNPPVTFQSAVFANGSTEAEMNASLLEISEKMKIAWDGPLPKPIPVMPERVTVGMLKSDYNNRYRIPVGIDNTSLTTAFADMTDNYCMLVTGSIGTGKSNMLSVITRMTAEKHSNSEIFVFDGLSHSLSGLRQTAKEYCVCDDDESVSEQLGYIISELNNRLKAQKEARTASGGSFDAKKFIADYNTIFIVIDDLKEFVEAVSDDNKARTERICRLAADFGVVVIAAGRMADMAKFNEIETLTRLIISYQNGIAMNGTPAQHTYFQNDLKYNERDNEAGEGFGYLFSAGKCIKIKLINGGEN